MEEVGEVSSCTIGCDCVMVCMCVCVRLAKCLLANARSSACSPPRACPPVCVCVCVHSKRSAAHACLLLQCKPEPTDHNIAYKSEFAVCD